MKEELLWSLLGAVIATLFNVLYNYITEANSRRWKIASEICGSIDFYYLRLITAVAHLESTFDDEQEALIKDEWRSIQNDVSPIFIDEQKIRAEIDIVFGINSYESNEFDSVFKLLKDNLSLALSISTKGKWAEKKAALKQGINQLARIRPTYRQKLVKKAKVWSIFTSNIN
ncbi:MAG: hypothetical protein GY820_37115 [Gammaproteobacteria bacterium]|nr:hypothetical protein [Gammaproteobacteria bacterium]